MLVLPRWYPNLQYKLYTIWEKDLNTNINGLKSFTVTVQKHFCCTQLHKLGSTIFNLKIKILLSQFNVYGDGQQINPLPWWQNSKVKWISIPFSHS